MKILSKAAILLAILALVVVLTPGVVDYIKSMIPPPKNPCGAPTQGAVAATTVPGIGLTADGKPWTGAANVTSLPWKAYPITLTNTTAAPTTIDAVRLWESIDHKFMPEEELIGQCRYMAISGGDCAPGSLPVTLAPNATCTITLSIGRPQTGYLDIQTGLGQLTLPILAK